MFYNHLRIVLKSAAVWLLVGMLAATPAPAQDVAAAARRLAATVQLAGGGDPVRGSGESGLGVRGGGVVGEPEVTEARLFLSEARRNADRIPGPASDRARGALDRLDSLVAPVADPDS